MKKSGEMMPKSDVNVGRGAIRPQFVLAATMHSHRESMRSKFESAEEGVTVMVIMSEWILSMLAPERTLLTGESRVT